MQEYLTTEPDLMPYSKMILWQNASYLFGLNENKPTAPSSLKDMFIRIADIEVYPEHINTFIEAGKSIAHTSLTQEPGVICLFPNQLKENPNLFKVIEVYASKEAYEHHITTPHFTTYKEKTAKMVKSLKLNDMLLLDETLLKSIFKL